MSTWRDVPAVHVDHRLDLPDGASIADVLDAMEWLDELIDVATMRTEIGKTRKKIADALLRSGVIDMHEFVDMKPKKKEELA